MFRLQHKNILKNKNLFLRIIVVPIDLFSKQNLDLFMALGHFLGMNPQKL